MFHREPKERGGIAPMTTPLGETVVEVPDEQPVLATILRAGLPLHQGLLNYFDRADSAFVSAYRKHRKGEESFDIVRQVTPAIAVEP